MSEDERERARVDALMARPMRRIREVASMEGVSLGYATTKEAMAREVASAERHWRHDGIDYVEVMA